MCPVVNLYRTIPGEGGWDTKKIFSKVRLCHKVQTLVLFFSFLREITILS